MIGLQYNSSIPTTLDLNGSYLSISTQPESTTVNDNGTATVTGVATIHSLIMIMQQTLEELLFSGMKLELVHYLTATQFLV